MASKCCSKCARTLPLSSFLADPSDAKSQIRVNCNKCRGYGRKSWYKRMALEPLDPNVSSKRPATAHLKPIKVPPTPFPYIQSEIRLEFLIQPFFSPESRPEALLLILPFLLILPSQPPPPPPPPPPLQATGFLPAD